MIKLCYMEKVNGFYSWNESSKSADFDLIKKEVILMGLA